MDDIKLKLNNSQIAEYKKGIKIIDIVNSIQNENKKDIIIAKFNNELTELNECLYEDGNIEFLNISSYEARRIYARGLSFVLIRAAMEVFPNCTVSIEHAIGKGLYGEIHKDTKLNQNEIKLIEIRMREIIKEDEIFEKYIMPLESAVQKFKKYNQTDKLSLLKNWKGENITLYKCGWMYDYFYGKMPLSTGYLDKFELFYYKPGFLLRYPDIYSQDIIPPFNEQKKLFSVFRETEEWGNILDVGNVGSLNDKVISSEMNEMIMISEALHEKKIARIADMITEKKEKIKIVLISGPSSSGKTTFAKRLSIQLKVNGLKPYAISLDDYFLSRDKTPKMANGEYDFESIYALDLKLLNQNLNELLNGMEIMLPTFDFISGERKYNGNTLKLTDGMVLIAEGIHGLNEMLTKDIKSENKFKIYVSALTQLNIDNHNRIPTTDVRLLRRILRDSRTRGRSAEETLLFWQTVREGEDKNIFPFQEEADIMFNSTLVYELGVLKRYIEPLLMQINKKSRAFSEADRLLNFLSYFLPVDDNLVPLNSIIREFIGNSYFYKD